MGDRGLPVPHYLRRSAQAGPAAWDRGKAKGRSPVARGLRPMIEAGGPSTSEFRDGPIRSVVPVPPTVVMVSPPQIPRNTSRAQCEGRAREGSTKRRQGHYEGRSP
jgi:hypothetical protein